MIYKNGPSLINTRSSIESIQYYICFIFFRYIFLSTNILTTKKILVLIVHQHFAQVLQKTQEFENMVFYYLYLKIPKIRICNSLLKEKMGVSMVGVLFCTVYTYIFFKLGSLFNKPTYVSYKYNIVFEFGSSLQ